MLSKWLKRFLMAFGGFSFVVIVYWSVANKGLGLVLNQAQASLFNGYYFPKLTAAILVLGVLILYAILATIIEQISGSKTDQQDDT